MGKMEWNGVTEVYDAKKNAFSLANLLATTLAILVVLYLPLLWILGEPISWKDLLLAIAVIAFAWVRTVMVKAPGLLYPFTRDNQPSGYPVTPNTDTWHAMTKHNAVDRLFLTQGWLRGVVIVRLKDIIGFSQEDPRTIAIRHTERAFFIPIGKRNVVLRFASESDCISFLQALEERKRG